MKKLIISTICLAFFPAFEAFSQEENKQQKTTDSIKKTIKIVETDSKEEKNRNVMLNAANNTGPRDVNIGLPSTVGGNFPSGEKLTVVFISAQMPKPYLETKTIFGARVIKNLGKPIQRGFWFFSVKFPFTQNLDDKNGSVGNFSGSSFGWMKGDLNVSGPLAKGWSYTMGAYANFDPNSFDLKFAKYSDRTFKILKAGFKPKKF
ncbi:hypothetical protein ACFFWB_18425 [Flavobacterium procerum]|uniref:hypothetical protein n=1 Tax=Flavobacterium procerum TaxID=1455569 RepID=UPI0035ED0832